MLQLITEKMWLIAMLIWTSRTAFASTQDPISQQNDIIPNQELKLPSKVFCYFTTSELIFENIMQQVAPSAYRVGAARLQDFKIIISASSQIYESVWGALYYIPQNEYTNVIQYAQQQNPVAFVATMRIETIENQSTICVLNDLGLQSNSYLFTQNCDSCMNGSSGNAPNTQRQLYSNELSRMGVPDTYLQLIKQLPTMQNSYSPSGAASTGGNSQQLTNQVPAYNGSGYGSNSQFPKNTSTNLAQSQALTNQPTPAVNTNNSSTDQLPGRLPHQLRNPNQDIYGTPSNPPSQESLTASQPPPYPYVPFSNQFLPQNPSIYGIAANSNQSPLTGANYPPGYSSSTYQPRNNFYTGSSTAGGSQLQYIPGFVLAFCNPNHSSLQPIQGSTFTDYKATISESSSSGTIMGWF